VVAASGRIVQVGLMGGGRTQVNVGLLLAKRATWIGTTLRARPIEQKVALTRRFAAEVLPLFDSGALRPIVDSRYPLGEIAAAHEHMAANANTGKIVVSDQLKTNPPTGSPSPVSSTSLAGTPNQPSATVA
jgi:NADPH:quinone reductase-like Zn-dependent oxidoreductase